LVWTAIAASIWATYAGGLAYVVGDALEDDHTLAFWVAFGTAMSINVLIEVVRHIRNRGHVDDVVVVSSDDTSAERTS
jgi:hypothetical protein